MAQQVFKNPAAQAESLKIPAFNKDAIVAYLKQYGTGFTDDNYKAWATKKGKKVVGKPLDPAFLKTDFGRQNYGDAKETYADQYLNDDEWLQEAWNELYEDAQDYYDNYDEVEFDDVDGDYERSYGPVDTRAKYKQYQDWKANGDSFNK